MKGLHLTMIIRQFNFFPRFTKEETFDRNIIRLMYFVSFNFSDRDYFPHERKSNLCRYYRQTDIDFFYVSIQYLIDRSRIPTDLTRHILHHIRMRLPNSFMAVSICMKFELCISLQRGKEKRYKNSPLERNCFFF